MDVHGCLCSSRCVTPCICVCAHHPAQARRPGLPATMCFQLAASRLGVQRRRVLGQLLRSGWASSGPPVLLRRGRGRPASMLSQRLGSHTKSPLSCASRWRLGPPPDHKPAVKTFRNSLPALTHTCAKAGIPFAVKFYFILLGRGVRGRSVLT